jgi:hypothetical protein
MNDTERPKDETERIMGSFTNFIGAEQEKELKQWNREHPQYAKTPEELINECPEEDDDTFNYVEPTKIQVKVRIISDRDYLKSELEAKRSIKCVHLVFRPANKDFMTLFKKCPNLKLVQIPKSYYVSVSQTMRELMIEKKVIFIEGDVWGHRRDISPWAVVTIEKSIYDEAEAKFK